jgi:hypothetical protein
MFNRHPDQTLRGTRPHPCNDTGARIRHARGSHVHSGACTSSPALPRTRIHCQCPQYSALAPTSPLASWRSSSALRLIGRHCLQKHRPHSRVPPLLDTGAHPGGAAGVSETHSLTQSGSRDTRSHARSMEKSSRSSNEREINNSTPSNRRSSVLKQASTPEAMKQAK